MNIRPYLIALGLASAVLAAGCNRTPDNASTDTSDMSSTTQNAVDETKDAGHSVADEAKQAANTVGEEADDGVLTTKVKSALLGGDTVEIDFASDKPIPAGKLEKRELGLIVSSVGLVLK